MSRKLLKFLILFDNSNLLYFPGQFVSGRVLVELEDETAVQGEITPPPLGEGIEGVLSFARRTRTCALGAGNLRKVISRTVPGAMESHGSQEPALLK